ncbi:hypothetical protein ACFYZ8_41905 [Streptomyces sp. NPDC001668]|uniref:hypothetical protein n=1 Tax=unclassified Streptomyces TaxID=2593676 RepID=UPI0036C90FA1
MKALKYLRDDDGEQYERWSAEAAERLVDVVAAITGEKREEQPRITFSDPESARRSLRCMVHLALHLTAYDLDLVDVRRCLRDRSAPVEPHHLGERLVAAGFDLNTAVRFPTADGVSQTFTVAEQATRDCDPKVKAGLKAVKYALAPSPFGLVNDVTTMLGRAEYHRHLTDVAKLVAALRPSVSPVESGPSRPVSSRHLYSGRRPGARRRAASSTPRIGEPAESRRSIEVPSAPIAAEATRKQLRIRPRGPRMSL